MSRQRSYSLRAEQGREFDAHRNGDAQISRTCLGRGFPATWRRRGHHTSYTPLPPVHSNPSSGVTLIGYGRYRIQPQLFDLDNKMMVVRKRLTRQIPLGGMSTPSYSSLLDLVPPPSTRAPIAPPFPFLPLYPPVVVIKLGGAEALARSGPGHLGALCLRSHTQLWPESGWINPVLGAALRVAAFHFHSGGISVLPPSQGLVGVRRPHGAR